MVLHLIKLESNSLKNVLTNLVETGSLVLEKMKII